jgi:hypothetical protein
MQCHSAVGVRGAGSGGSVMVWVVVVLLVIVALTPNGRRRG